MNLTETEIPPKKAPKKRALTLFAWFIGISLNVFVLLYFLLQTPTAQKWIGDHLASYLSKKINSTVTIGQIKIGVFAQSIYLSNLLIEDQQKDTLFFFQGFKIKIKDFSIDNSSVVVKELTLNQPKISFSQKDSTFNFDFLSSLFQSSDTTSKESKFKIDIRKLSVSNGKFKFENKGYDKSIIDFSKNTNITSLNLFAEKIFITQDSLGVKLKSIRLIEKNGFRLRNLTTSIALNKKSIQLDSLHIITSNSELFTHISTDNKWLAKGENLYKIPFNVSIDKLHFNPKDLTLLGVNTGFNEIVVGNGSIRGSIANLRAKKLELMVGEALSFKGNVNLKGLPDIDKTLIDIKADRIQLDRDEILRLTQFKLPESISVPAQLTYNGTFIGFTNDFVSIGKLETSYGNLNTDINLKLSDKETSFSGKLKSANLNLGLILKNQTLGLLSFNGKVNGKTDNAKNIDATLDGYIDLLQYNQYNYQGIGVNGIAKNKSYLGQINSKDPNANLDFIGKIDFSEKDPKIDFNANVTKLDLQALHLSNDSITIYGKLDIKASGSDPDKIVSNGTLNNFFLQVNNRNIALDTLSFSTGKTVANNHFISVFSDVFDLSIDGEYHYKTIIEDFLALAKNYLPNTIELNNEPKSKQILTASLDVKKPSQVLDLLSLDHIKVSPFKATGEINTDIQKLQIATTIDTFTINNLGLFDINLNTSSTLRFFKTDVSVKKATLNKSTLFQDILLASRVKNDSILFNVSLIGDDKYNHIDVAGVFELIGDEKTLHFNPSELQIAGNTWNIDTTSTLIFTKEGVQINKFDLEHFNEFIRLSGVYKNNASDSLKLSFQNLDLQVFNPFLSIYSTQIEGTINGDVVANDFKNNLALNTTLNIDEFVLDGDPIADLQISSRWNNAEQKAIVDVYGFRNSDSLGIIHGTVLTAFDDPPIDFDIQLKQTTLSPLNKLLEPDFSDFSGWVSANLKFNGTLNHPNLLGTARVENGRFKVGILNTFYNFSDTVDFSSNWIDFKEATIKDDFNGTGKLSGKILHKNFRDTRFDLLVNAKNLQVLNTIKSSGDAYYGVGFGTGYCSIEGPVNKVNIDVSIKTESGTAININVEDEGGSNQSSFVYFLNTDSLKIKKPEIEEDKIDLSGVNLALNINVTNDADLNLIFDQVSGDIIRGKGNGIVKIEYDTQGNLRMNGGYTITSGDYLFTYENLINKKFRIQEGSTIVWTGDPFDAQLNLSAVYKLRSYVKNLLTPEILASSPNLDTNQIKNLRYTVDVVLKMTGKLLSPSLGFEIRFPTLNMNDQSDPLVAQLTAINNNEQELNKQVFSLIVMNDFAAQSNAFFGPGFSISNSLSNSVSELFSNQISNWISQYSGNVNVGINYRDQNLLGGNSLTNTRDFTVALNTSLLNNRLVIDGNIGTNYLVTQQTQNLGADFSFDYKLTNDGKLRIGAYNKLDDRMIINRESNYRQGLKLSYRKDFDTFGELITDPIINIFTRFGINKLIPKRILPKVQ